MAAGDYLRVGTKRICSCPKLLRTNPKRSFFTPERCYIVELENSNDDEGCSIAHARVRPGVTTQLHAAKNATERYVILEGEGKAEIGGGVPTIVRPLDVVAIPAEVSQRITNIGKTNLIFLCVCTPRFRPESYLDMSS